MSKKKKKKVVEVWIVEKINYNSFIYTNDET